MFDCLFEYGNNFIQTNFLQETKKTQILAVYETKGNEKLLKLLSSSFCQLPFFFSK